MADSAKACTSREDWPSLAGGGGFQPPDMIFSIGRATDFFRHPIFFVIPILFCHSEQREEPAFLRPQQNSRFLLACCARASE